MAEAGGVTTPGGPATPSSGSRQLKMLISTTAKNQEQLRSLYAMVTTLQEDLVELEDELESVKKRLKSSQTVVKALWKRQRGSELELSTAKESLIKSRLEALENVARIDTPVSSSIASPVASTEAITPSLDRGLDNSSPSPLKPVTLPLDPVTELEEDIVEAISEPVVFDEVPYYEADFSLPTKIHDYELEGGAKIRKAPGGISRALRISDTGEGAKLPVNVNPSKMLNCTLVVGVYLESIVNDSNGWILTSDDGGYDRSIVLHDSRFKGMGMATGKNRTVWEDTTNAETGKWIHVVAVFRKGKQCYFYVDGQQAPITPTCTNGEGKDFMYIGSHINTSHRNSHRCDGWIKEVKVYDRDLTGTEVQALSAAFQKEVNLVTNPFVFDEIPFYEVDFSLPKNKQQNYTLDGGKISENAPGGISRALRISDDGSGAKLPVNVNPSKMPNCTLVVGVYLESIASGSKGWLLTSDNGGYDRSVVLHDSRFKGMGMATGKNRTVWKDTTNAETGKWIHVVAVFRKGKQCYFYVDGQQAPTTPTCTNGEGKDYMYLGSCMSTNASLRNSHRCDGWIKEVKVYDRALDGSEVQALSATFQKEVDASNNYYLIVAGGQVVFDNNDLEACKKYLMDKYGRKASQPSRMIVEVGTDEDVDADPHDVGGQNQGGGFDAGFNKWWRNWDDIKSMTAVAEKWVKERHELAIQKERQQREIADMVANMVADKTVEKITDEALTDFKALSEELQSDTIRDCNIIVDAATANGLERITAKAADALVNFGALSQELRDDAFQSCNDMVADATAHGIEKITVDTAEVLANFRALSEELRTDTLRDIKDILKDASEISKSSTNLKQHIDQAQSLADTLDKLTNTTMLKDIDFKFKFYMPRAERLTDKLEKLTDKNFLLLNDDDSTAATVDTAESERTPRSTQFLVSGPSITYPNPRNRSAKFAGTSNKFGSIHF